MTSRFSLAQENKHLVLFAIIVVLFVALRLWHLTAYGLWFDEAFSHQAAQLGWGGLIRYVIADIVHPPLFYLLLKLWINIGGESLLWLKLFPVLTSIATLVPFLLLCKELKLTAGETNTALFLIAVNALLIHYAQELRMYSLLVFFSLWSCCLFVRLLNGSSPGKQLLAGLFVVNLLVVYTQYLGWLVVGVEGLYLLCQRRQLLKLFSATVAGVALCYLPWAYLIFHSSIIEGRGLGELVAVLSRPGLRDVTWYFATLNGPFFLHRTTLVGLVLFGAPLLVWGWRVLQGQRQALTVFRVLVSFSFVPLISIFVGSYLLRPMWTERYLIVTAVPYLTLTAVAIHQLKTTWLRTVALLLIAGWAGLSGVQMLSRGNYRFDWLGLARHMVQSEPGKRVTVYTFERHVATPLEASLLFLGDDRFQILRIEDVTEMQGSHFWIAFRDTTWGRQPSPQTFVTAARCQAGPEFSVSNHAGKNADVGEAVTAFPVTCPR